MISQQDKSVIKMTLQSPGWRVIQQVCDEMIKNWQNQSKLGQTEWETARNVIRDEGRCEGIRNLVQELYKLAND